MIYSATVKQAGLKEGTWIVQPHYSRIDGQPAPTITSGTADGIVPAAGDIVLCAESINGTDHKSVRDFDNNGGAYPVIIGVFSQIFTTKCDVTIKGKATLGEGKKKMVLGDDLETWAKNVDAAIQALYTWAKTGAPPIPAVPGEPTGGIAPFPGTPAYQAWQTATLSKNHTLD